MCYTVPNTAYSKRNKARDVVRMELSEPEGNASAHGMKGMYQMRTRTSAFHSLESKGPIL